jgi:hypothetical protein
MPVCPASWLPTGGGPAGHGAPVVGSPGNFYYDGVNQNRLEVAVNSVPSKPFANVVAQSNQVGTYNQPAGGSNAVGATFTYTATGPTVIDGHTLGALEKVLLVSQTAPAQNGLYDVTTPGSTGVSTILTRNPALNSSADFPGALVTVGGDGTTYGGTAWLCVATGSPVMGTSALPFDEFSPTSVVILNTSSPASVTLNPQTFQCYKITGLANQLALDLTGSPPDRYPFEVLITDNNTPQNLIWTAKFAPMGVVGALPNVTPMGKRMTMKFIYDVDNATAMLAAIDGVGY